MATSTLARLPLWLGDNAAILTKVNPAQVTFRHCSGPNPRPVSVLIFVAVANTSDRQGDRQGRP
jgi:hypothetical protein